MRSSAGFACWALVAMVAFASTASGAVEPEWTASAVEHIRTMEYEFSEQVQGAWSAPNRAHGLRSRLTREGLLVEPRYPTEDPWQVGLRLTGVGRQAPLAPPGFFRLQADGKRAELIHDRLTDWYVNDTRGLQQAFTLLSTPAGRA